MNEPLKKPAATSPAPRGLRCPGRALWIAFAKYVVLLQLLWLLIYGGADWVADCHSYRVRWHLDFELAIPLFPAASIVYLSLFPLLWLAPFVLHSVEQLREFAKALAILIGCSGIGFLAFPSQPSYAYSEITGPFAAIYHFMDSINLSYNMLPSLHVGMAVVCTVAFSRVLRYSCWVWIWAIAIALSTLFTHEHHLLDIAAGGVLGFAIAVQTFHA